MRSRVLRIHRGRAAEIVVAAGHVESDEHQVFQVPARVLAVFVALPGESGKRDRDAKELPPLREALHRIESVRWQSVHSLSPGSSTNGARNRSNWRLRACIHSSSHGPSPAVMSPTCAENAKRLVVHAIDQAVEQVRLRVRIRHVAHQAERVLSSLLRRRRASGQGRKQHENYDAK
jgi:hypothetical protein